MSEFGDRFVLHSPADVGWWLAWSEFHAPLRWVRSDAGWVGTAPEQVRPLDRIWGHVQLAGTGQSSGKGALV